MRRAQAAGLALVACLVASSDALAQQGERPRIGLALSGGGARGFAHVGVLRALESLRIPIDCIAGTSAGSAIGAAYASGLSPDQIERQLSSVNWDREMFQDAPPRRDLPTRKKSEEKAYLLDLTLGVRGGSVVMPPGLVAGQKIELFLHRLLGASTVLASFDQLPIPFRAMATDIETGELVIQDRGSLASAVRASMAVPSVFAPVEVGGRLLVDGGLSRNMPVDVVRSMCADAVIAVDIGSPLLKREELGNVLNVASQMIGVLMERNMRESREQIRPGQDLMIQPDLGEISAASFSRGVQGIPAGEAAARAVADQLRRWSLSESDYAAWQAARAAKVVRDNRYAGVRMVGADAATRRSLMQLSELPASGELDQEAVSRSIARWSGQGDFERIGYSLVPEAPTQALEISLVQRAWGPNYVRFGLGASADSNANGVFNVLFGFRRPGVNDWGGEFKTELQFGSTRRFTAEFFQPINRGDFQFFVDPQLLSEEVPVWLFQGSRRIAEYGVRSNQLGVDLGVQGRIGETRLGVFTGQRDTFPRTGSTVLLRSHDRYQGAQLLMLADQLDATDFPREGYLIGAQYRVERVSSDLTSDYTAQRALLYGKQVGSIGDHTFAAAFRIGEATSNVALNQAFSLGGFMNLSGLQLNQILGTSLRYASVSYQNQLLTLPDPLGRGVYAGLALEGAQMRGQTLGLQESGWLPGATAFIGAHTAIGPIYLGYGYARGNNRLIYLFLGRPGL